MQHQELELAGDIGKYSQSQRNYEQNLAEMTQELWRVSDCEELLGGYLQEMMGLVLGWLFLECDSCQLIFSRRSRIIPSSSIASRSHDVS